jgi:hypothetical protein
MEGFIYELAAGTGQALMRPWLLIVAGAVMLTVVSGLAGRIAIVVENRLAVPPPLESTPPSHRTNSIGGE